MSIHFICPHCAAATDIAEKYAGQTGPCAYCGKSITIPAVEGDVSVPRRSSRAVIIFILAGALGVAVLCVAVLAALLLPAVSSAREAARRMTCVNNMTQISLALRQYESANNGYFPPAFIPDKDGKPMHSWRVLLLPYLGQQDLYDRYRFNEPWDSPNNRVVSDLTLGLFQCPSQTATSEPTTNYMMVVGPRTITNGSESKKIDEITDGVADTILLVEVADSAVRWAEPVDLQFDKISFGINASKRQGISSHHPMGANVAFCDGSVRLLTNSTNPQLVKAMLTVDGGEKVEREP